MIVQIRLMRGGKVLEEDMAVISPSDSLKIVHQRMVALYDARRSDLRPFEVWLTMATA